MRRKSATLASVIESLESRRLLATFTAELVPLNNSGVSGTATFNLEGNSLTVTINARGLEVDQVHAAQIRGRFETAPPNTSRDSVIPTPANDTDNDGFIELNEAIGSTGEAILPLSSPPADDSAPNPDATLKYPTVAADGSITFTQVYDLTVGTQFFDPTTKKDFSGQDLLALPLRVITLHGLTVDATAGVGTTGEVNGTAGYKSELPVAAGEIVEDVQPPPPPGGGAEGVFQLPAGATGAASLPVNWTTRDAVYDNEVGFFLTDADGSVNGLAPGAAGWAEAALRSSSRQILFAAGSGAGAQQTITVTPTDHVVFYIIQDDTTENFLAKNPSNSITGLPLAFFSITAANPDADKHAQFTTTTTNDGQTTEMRWEDLTDLGDNDFNDVVFTVALVSSDDGGGGGGGGGGGPLPTPSSGGGSRNVSRFGGGSDFGTYGRPVSTRVPAPVVSTMQLR